MTLRLPNALVIGPMKAGTSWIHDYLAHRGDVCLPNGVKETFFFDRLYERGPEWYGSLFGHYDPARHRRIVEVAPSLFHHPQAPERVARTLGSVPLVVTLRDPVKRSWSHYLHLRRKGYTDAPLREAVAAHPQIVTASRYDAMIARWRAAMPDAPIAVLHLETLKDDYDGYALAVADALGLPASGVPDSLRSASGAAAEAPSFRRARLGRTLGYAFRDAGLYSIVNAAKKLGLKRFFFGNPQKDKVAIKPAAEDLAWLADEIGPAAQMGLPTAKR